MKCRHCGNERFIPFADLQNCPPSNAMLTKECLYEPEIYYPLVVEVCDRCYLAQVDEHKSAREIFDSDYTYFSSFSRSWLEHAARYAAMATERFGLNSQSQVVEIASNDGYLLQYFQQRDIPVLGVEPTANTAEVATAKGITTIVDFFGKRLAEERLTGAADLIVGNNVFAHVPDINDFAAVECSAEARGCNHPRVSASAAADREGISSIRSTTSISLTCRFIQLSGFSRTRPEHV